MKENMIRNILIGFFAVCALTASAQGQSNVIDEVVWVVGDEAILNLMWKTLAWKLCSRASVGMAIRIV